MHTPYHANLIMMPVLTCSRYHFAAKRCLERIRPYVEPLSALQNAWAYTVTAQSTG